jgi:centromere protein T
VDRLFKAWVQMPVSKQALDEVYSQSHAFLQRTCEDLQAFAKHAGRKTVESSDVALHMKVSEEKLVTMVRETLPMEYQEALLPVVRAAAPSEDAS